MDRNELKGKQTPGVTMVRGGMDIYGMGGGYFCASTRGSVEGEYDCANASLYAEAHNVANETGMWPLDLVERIKELEGGLSDALKIVANAAISGATRWTTDIERIEAHKNEALSPFLHLLHKKP